MKSHKTSKHSDPISNLHQRHCGQQLQISLDYSQHFLGFFAPLKTNPSFRPQTQLRVPGKPTSKENLRTIQTSEFQCTGIQNTQFTEEIWWNVSPMDQKLSAANGTQRQGISYHWQQSRNLSHPQQTRERHSTRAPDYIYGMKSDMGIWVSSPTQQHSDVDATAGSIVFQNSSETTEILVPDWTHNKGEEEGELCPGWRNMI